MQFVETQLKMYVGGRVGGTGSGSGGWCPSSVFVDWTGGYYAFVIDKRDGTGYWSFVTQQLYPVFQIKNGDNVISTLRVTGDVYLDNPVYNTIEGNQGFFAYYVIGKGFVMVDQYKYVGYCPNDDYDQYWEIQHAYMIYRTGYQPLGAGQAVPKGKATATYTIQGYWPRWELQGCISGYAGARYPKAGLYLPCDGMEGNIALGEYDEATGEYVQIFKTANIYMGEQATWS